MPCPAGAPPEGTRGGRHPPVRLALIGTGRAAHSLGGALAEAGHAVAQVAGRDAAAASALAARLGARAVAPTAAARGVDGVVVAVADRAVAAVALEAAVGGSTGALWIHLSGILPAAVLRPAAAAAGGGDCLALHPLAVLDGTPRRLAGATVVLEGDGAAVARGRLLAEDLGARWAVIDAADKTAYHLAASLAAGHLLAMAGLAQAVAERAGLAPELRDGLWRLAAEAVGAGGARGAAALTGPAVRGDAASVAAHLNWLAERGDPSWREAYRAVAATILDLAGAAPAVRQRMAVLLAGGDDEGSVDERHADDRA
jgi:predicted short-subunit dehydrogenase-like oxidoreductase (DUF2520 family)